MCEFWWPALGVSWRPCLLLAGLSRAGLGQGPCWLAAGLGCASEGFLEWKMGGEYKPEIPGGIGGAVF